MENNIKNIETNESITPASTLATAPKKRGRRKKSDSMKAIVQRQETAAPKSSTPVWFSVASNLAILIAIFTIVFAAHRGLQNNKNTEVVILEQQTDALAVTDIVTTPESQAVAVAAAETTENAMANTIEAANETTTAETNATSTTDTAAHENTKTQEPPVNVEVKPAVSMPVKKAIAKTDPYTDGGPLDLDRRENIVKRASEQMKNDTKTANAAEANPATTQTAVKTPAHEVKKAPHLYTDINNPWNGRGDEDLDSPKNREQYKKSFIETGTSAK